ncbi:Methyltransferase FkbM [Candidatus Methylacidiphilaceae bacterium]
MKKEELISELKALLNESPESVAERERTAHDKLTTSFNNQLILFGTGKLGRRTLKGLREVGIEPLAFCDNNSVIWGSDIEGLKVLSPEQAVSDFGTKAAFVVTIWNDTLGHPLEVVRQQLQSYGNCTVVSFLPLYWKYHGQFLPYFSLDRPSKILAAGEGLMDIMLFVRDDESRSSFFKNIKSRFTGELGILPSPIDKCIQFKNEFLKANKEEVFVDAGAYTGDTLRLVLESPALEFREYIALEPDPQNFKRLKKLIRTFDEELRSKITTFPVAAGTFNGEICFDGSGTEQARISQSGHIKVGCRRIDNLFKDKEVTFIKMDIEGAEPDAIEGASNIIKNKSPILAVSVYHQIDHLWRILSLINNMNNGYAFFFRPHGAGGWDYILYAVPQNRLATPVEA